MSHVQVAGSARLLGIAAVLQLGMGCAVGRNCDWTCGADAYIEAERDAAESMGAPERIDRAWMARRAAEMALLATCVPPVATVTASVSGGGVSEQQRGVVVADVRGYDAPALLSALLASYPGEHDAMARIRILRVLRLAKESSFDRIAAFEFDVLRREAEPSVMAAAMNVVRRLGTDMAPAFLAEYMSRGPRWVLVAAYGVAKAMGIAEAVRAELTRRGASDALDVIVQWEKTGETPWDPAKPEATEPSK